MRTALALLATVTLLASCFTGFVAVYAEPVTSTPTATATPAYDQKLLKFVDDFTVILIGLTYLAQRKVVPPQFLTKPEQTGSLIHQG